MCLCVAMYYVNTVWHLSFIKFTLCRNWLTTEEFLSKYPVTLLWEADVSFAVLLIGLSLKVGIAKSFPDNMNFGFYLPCFSPDHKVLLGKS